MRNEVARVYAELVDQALQHVKPDGKNEGPKRHIEQVERETAIEQPINSLPDVRE